MANDLCLKTFQKERKKKKSKHAFYQFLHTVSHELFVWFQTNISNGLWVRKQLWLKINTVIAKKRQSIDYAQLSGPKQKQ